MAADGTFTGVVDRFEADRAVVLLEADGETIDEIVLDKDRLPEDGRHVDAVLTIELEDGGIQEIAYEADETESRSERAQRRFDSLSQRPPTSEDDSGST
ncbi:hypothetical protein HLRTI_003108 [Halorhabdus tiamatea SARL4B]|uniref:DUF3006 domain-containing protein n=1 Tax=Halorhabdus tiamatea SARL4B TaxID=1033806 RepID=F7PLD8_9EURY|nr:DUF3006 domain-containing protein [Halorhabdus tiamatea]ERJ04933.1 hypothetical protein HLRTI_003108 [Halorhabdus tiamatea SARL4B]CCQ34989.1 conserved hypothetical protein (DUF3006) [Halorhabdus tiamatea SARL4B]